MKATYSEEVTVEKVEFTKEDKDRLIAGEVAFGAGCRMRSVSEKGEKPSFFTPVTINNQAEIADEGDYIVTFKDGTQILMSEDEAKAQLVISKKKDEASDKAPQVIITTTDGPQVMLSPEKSAELLSEDAAASKEAKK